MSVPIENQVVVQSALVVCSCYRYFSVRFIGHIDNVGSFTSRIVMDWNIRANAMGFVLLAMVLRVNLRIYQRKKYRGYCLSTFNFKWYFNINISDSSYYLRRYHKLLMSFTKPFSFIIMNLFGHWDISQLSGACKNFGTALPFDYYHLEKAI